jgi:hypothetical protein
VDPIETFGGDELGSRVVVHRSPGHAAMCFIFQ